MTPPPDRQAPPAVGSLELGGEELAALASAVGALVGEHRATIADRPVGRVAGAAELRAALAPISERGCPPERALAELSELVLPNIVQQDHPRYFASIPSPGNAVSAFADALAAGLNVFGGNWAEGSGASAIELACLEWLCDLCGLPAGAGGLFVSGGTAATLTALTAARQHVLGGPAEGAVLYTSSEGHLSIERAGRVLGLGPEQIRHLGVDERLRLDIAALREAVAADRAGGRRPFAVVATAGSTSTAVIDDLAELARWCRAERIWLHVDAAYGGPALLTARGRELLRGIELADSITIDPHKWLFQPFGLGCLLVRDPALLRDAFRLVPDYLEELSSADDVDFYDYGIEVSRPFRALRLWLSLRVFGVAAFREAIEHGFGLAEVAAAAIGGADSLELITGPQLGVVCFAPAAPALDASARDRVSDLAAQALGAEGWAVVGCTRVSGRRVLRMCAMNPRTTAADVRETIRRLDEHARRAALSNSARASTDDGTL